MKNQDPLPIPPPKPSHIAMVLILFLLSCAPVNPEREYCGCKVVGGFYGNVMELERSDGKIIRETVPQYYWNKYKLGDKIQCDTITAIEFNFVPSFSSKTYSRTWAVSWNGADTTFIIDNERVTSPVFHRLYYDSIGYFELRKTAFR